MPVIEHRKIVNAPVDKVYQIARDVERFPEFMSDVKSIEILESAEDGNCLKTRWVGRIPQFGLTVKWVQEDLWDPVKHRTDFHQVQGDYDKLEGHWQFIETDGQTEFRSYIDYEYNVPLVGPLLHKVVKHIVTKNIDSIMEAIKVRAETAENLP